MEPKASNLVSVGIPALAVLVALVFVWEVGAAARRAGKPPTRSIAMAAVGATAWLGVTAVLASSGMLARFDARPPPIAPFMLAVVVLGLGLGVSRVGAGLSRLPLALLVGVQSFRLPLELVMHQAAREGVMPPQMSFGGWNYDIVVGALALPVAFLVARGRASKALVTAWNVLGFVTLSVILVVAVASTPFVHSFGNAPASLNTWVAYFPFVWLPAGPVVFAIAGHVIVLRALRSTQSFGASASPPASRAIPLG
jgi:hypothetical protein